MKKLHATLGALALSAGVLTVALATAASATPACVADVRSNTSGVTLTAGGKATPTADGLKMEVFAQADAANWRQDVASAPLKSVIELSYRTRRLDGSTAPAALPAFKLYLGQLDGANETATLVFEPYYQAGVGNPPTGTTTTWDADAGKWWSSKAFEGYAGHNAGGYDTNITLAQVREKNPKAVVLGYGVGLGTWNEITFANVNLVTFRSWHGTITPSCRVTTWTAPVASSSSTSASASSTSSSPAASSSSSASASPSSSSQSATASTSPSASSTPAPVFNAGNRLPTTGAAVPITIGVGGLLLAGGAALWYFSRRRNDEFEAV